MAYERLWPRAQQYFTANGQMDGGIQVADPTGFFVTARIALTSTTQQPRYLQIKKIVTETTPYIIYVGSINEHKADINARADVSAFLVADNAQIVQAEQEYGFIKPEYIANATYERDPVKAWRVEPVDDKGNPISEANPLPVAFSAAFPNVVEITSGNGDGNKVLVNADGSINVVTATGPPVPITYVSQFTAASSVPTSVLTTIGTYTVPALKTGVLEKVDLTGSNIGKFSVLVNSVEKARRRTWYSNFNEVVDFTDGDGNGLALSGGDIVTVTVIHSQPYVGDFESRIQVLVLG